VTAHKKVASYEPVFGGLAATLAAVFLCFVLLSPTQPHQSHTGTAYLVTMGGSVIGWGIGQVIGYRKARRDKIMLSPPTFGAALGCMFFGLILILLTVLMYLFVPTHMAYAIVSGTGAVLLLLIGAAVGIREGVWRGS
jgi:hypothetical protein